MVELINELQAGFSTLIHNYFFIALIGVITFDYLTGIVKAYIWKVGDSQVGLKGLTKHGLIVLAFLFVYPFAGVFNGGAFVDIVATLYCLNYLISILENFAVMGIYVPKFLENKVRAEINRYEKQLDEGISAKQLAAEESAPSQTVKVEIETPILNDKVSETTEIE